MSLLGAKRGPQIDSFDFIVRLKYGHELTRLNPTDYGTKTNAVASTLKTWHPYYKIRPRLQEWWGYQNWPGQADELGKIKLYFVDTFVRTELEAVAYWLGVYRELANVLTDHTDKFSSYAKEGDEPWCSTGMGANIIAAASGLFGEINLVGFDTTRKGKRMGKDARQHYRSVFRESDWKYPPHAWEIEAQLLRRLSEHYGVPMFYLDVDSREPV